MLSVPSTPTVPMTPVTPIDLAGISALRDIIRRDAQDLDSGSQRRLQKHVQKLSKAAEVSFVEHTLLEQRNEFLQRTNSEARVRRSTRSKVIGTARVMSYEDLEKARDERALRDARPMAKRRSRTRTVHNVIGDSSNMVQTQTNSAGEREGCTDPQTRGLEVYQAPTARMW
jgi:hypothetical protein